MQRIMPIQIFTKMKLKENSMDTAVTGEMYQTTTVSARMVY